jgi:hypothetical protein
LTARTSIRSDRPAASPAAAPNPVIERSIVAPD